MTDLKTSLLVNRQVPEFVREEHPKFISFLEAYYEFLDQSAGASGKAKQLRNISDVDESLDEFEQQFFNCFLPFIPRDVDVNKELIIKHIMPLYLSKGSERAYRLLFRMLFGEEITIQNPGKQILRASDGRWLKESFLRVELDAYSEYTANGNTSIYYLPYEIDSSDVTVYVDNVISTDYEFRKEYRKIIFDSAPASNSVVRIAYNNFNVGVLENRRISGLSSNAYALIEKAGVKSVSGVSSYQLFINPKTTFGTFSNGETLECDIRYNGYTIPIFLKAYSDISSITVVNGGSFYNIGDPVIVLGESINPAVAVVESIATGAIEELIVLDGGAGFKVDNDVLAQNVSQVFFQAYAQTVDTSGANTANSISFNIDLISDYANVNISNLDFGFPANTDADVNAVISTALTSNTLSNIGPITSIYVANSSISSGIRPTFFAQSTVIFSSTRVGDLGAIARITINNGGQSYNIGDYLVFTNTLSFSGQGANAYVSNVSANGAITKIAFNNPGLGYQEEYYPTVTVNSANGSGANLEVSALFGQGENISYVFENETPGRILTIKILESGSGYTSAPLIDLSRSGSGTATAYSNLGQTVVQLSGKWTTSDSILSDDQIRLQGQDYYINYSYVIGSKVEFQRYKTLLKNLLHPAGYINYARYKIEEEVSTGILANGVSTLTLTVPGTVSVTNNSNTITGTNTYFQVANTLGIIGANSVIVINDETRNVITVSSNTTIVVNNVFTSNSSNTTIKILA
jgi:hypothetical protein